MLGLPTKPSCLHPIPSAHRVALFGMLGTFGHFGGVVLDAGEWAHIGLDDLRTVFKYGFVFVYILPPPPIDPPFFLSSDAELAYGNFGAGSQNLVPLLFSLNPEAPQILGPKSFRRRAPKS